MSIHFVNKHMVGYMPILEASEGYLIVGRKVDDGIVCETFFEALEYMNGAIERNRQAFRKVRIAKVVEYEGMVWCPALDDDQKPTSRHA